MGKRIVDWFWPRARAEHVRGIVRANELLVERARASADMADVALSLEPQDARYEAIACELYRQAAHWATVASSTDGSPPATFEGDFVSVAELSPEQQRDTRLALRATVEALLTQLEEPSRRTKALGFQRAWRLGLLVLLVGVVGSALWSRLFGELAVGKEWRASSNYGSGGCTSPAQSCVGNNAYFFHTKVNDHNPWIEFDLADDERVSVVKVENRQDCCAERAVPLLVEISRDHRTWQPVARRDAIFSSWRASFDPVRARWVRLRAPQGGPLHLFSVRIYH